MIEFLLIFTVDSIPENLTWSNMSNTPPLSKCPQKRCPSGYEIKLDIVPANTTIWEKQRAMVCSKCQRNFVKSTAGFGNCVLCPGITISNNKRTKCIDPYNNNYLKWRDTSAIISICLSIIGVLFCFLTIVLFVKHRKTPFITSSNVISSISQLFSALLFFVIFLVTVIGEPTSFKCKIQSVFVGFIFTFILANLLTKVQKTLTVFQARRKITRHEKLVSESIRIFITALLLVSCVTIYGVTLLLKEIKVISLLDANVMQRNMYCNSHLHFHCQVVYIILLLLFCNIQGYRARRLPESFKETKVIIYGSFISIVCLLLIFPLFYSQVDEVKKARVHLIALPSAMLILCFTMFGGRIFIIVFRSDLNTKEHAQQDIMMKIKKDVLRLTVPNHSNSNV